MYHFLSLSQMQYALLVLYLDPFALEACGEAPGGLRNLQFVKVFQTQLTYN